MSEAVRLFGSVSAQLKRVPALGWVVLVAAALLLPGLGGFGFWEPWEARLVADPAASGAAERSGPPATAALIALGRRLGTDEAGPRALFALAGLATVLAVYWAGVGLFRRRAAVLAALALVSLPLFSFQARQLLSDMPLVLGLALALAGLGRFLWPASPAATALPGRLAALGVGLGGLVLGLLGGGALVGVAVPCAAVAAAGFAERSAEAGRARRLWLAGLAAVAVLVIVVSLVRTHTAGVYSSLLGGVPRLGGASLTFEWLIRQVGFGLFPFGALAFFALARPLVSEDDRRAGPGLLLLFFAAFALALSTVRGHLVGEVRFAALAPIALALGVFLDELADRDRPEPVTALLAAVGTVVVARDLYLGPEELFSVHALQKVKWPTALDGRTALLAAGIAFAAATWLAVGTRRRWGVAATMAVGLAFSALVTQQLVPALSQHLSPRSLIQTYRRAASAGEPLARYRVEAEGASALRSAPGPQLSSTAGLADFLGGAARAFAVIPAEELAPVDEALKLAGRSYAVLDASSSRLLLLSNRLAPGETDRNPLRRFVFMPSKPDEQPPWPPPRVVLSSVFADAIELVGADFPTSVRRPGSFKLVLIFKVLKRPPPAHGIFVHLSTPGEPLVNGDHQPVGGTFPTTHWLPGEFIRDEFSMDLPLAVTPAGTYELVVGMWPGGNRPGLHITAGRTNGRDGCPLGTVVIR